MNVYWTQDGADWGFTIGPYACIMLFILLLYVAKGVAFTRPGTQWSWLFSLPQYRNIDLADRAPLLTEEQEQVAGIRGRVTKVLNTI